MRGRLIVVALLLGCILASGWRVFHRRGDKPAHRTRAPVALMPFVPNPAGSPPVWISDDPEGPLVIEGRVIGPDGQGVGGAEVWLRAKPSRTVTTDRDGSFSFPQLLGQEYALFASKDEWLGGTAHLTLTATSAPVMIRLAPAPAIRVTVHDSAGHVVQGAKVKVTVSDGLERTGITAADGAIRLAPIQAGMAAVEASAPGYGPGGEAVLMGPGTGTTEVAITLHHGYRISGRVVDDRGNAIANARVSASRGRRVLEAAKVLTDGEGRFAIPGLSNGSYTLSAIDGEHAPAIPLPVRVSGAALDDLELVMQAGGVISGTIVDTAARPVPFASVLAVGEQPRDARSDHHGAFELHGLARSPLEVHAESEAATSSIRVADLAATPEIRGLTLVLDVEGTIEGTVVNENGAPVASVQVTALPAMAPQGPQRTLSKLNLATTDEDGHFSVRGLPDGEYRMGAVARFHVLGGLGQQVNAKTGDHAIRLVLATPGSLVGKVTFAGVNAVPKVFTVQLRPDGGMPASGANGTFEYKDIAPGVYSVLLRSPEFADTMARNVAVKPGTETNLGTMIVDRGRQMTGKVVDESGALVGGAQVKLLINATGDDFESLVGARAATADQLGTFTITGVPTIAGAPVNTMTVVAYDPDRGRSNAMVVPEGKDDLKQVTLMLK